jgi:hypothetical protein
MCTGRRVRTARPISPASIGIGRPATTACIAGAIAPFS